MTVISKRKMMWGDKSHRFLETNTPTCTMKQPIHHYQAIQHAYEFPVLSALIISVRIINSKILVICKGWYSKNTLSVKSAEAQCHPAVLMLVTNLSKLQFYSTETAKQGSYSKFKKTKQMMLWSTDVDSCVLKALHEASSSLTAKAFMILSTKWAPRSSLSPTDTVLHRHLSLYTVTAGSDKIIIIIYWTSPASG